MVNHAVGQEKNTKETSTTVLQKVSAKLSAIKTVRYNFIRECLYKGENYHNVYSPAVYFDFGSTNNAAGYLFQAEDKEYFSCYNGIQYFGLNHNKKTIDIQQKPKPVVFESLSPLYFSIASLRNIVAILLQNDKIDKLLSDTIIDNKPCYSIRFSLYDQYFSGQGKMEAFTADYIGDKKKPYTFIITKSTLLPYLFIARFNDKPADFISAKYVNIDLRPAAPDKLSWFYSTYTTKYTAPKPANPYISVGSVLENWRLPAYYANRIDTVSLYQYRGKIVLLDFWIKSCGPCMASFPHLNELQQKFGSDKFQLLSINAEDNKEDIAFFFKKHKPVYKMLFDGEKLAEQYGVPGFPSIILLDRLGRVIYASTNGFDQPAIEKIIQENL